jgi:putative ABC transport system permease protein
MDAWLNDIRIALRLLRRRPGWTAAVLATLALAIGANTALFSILDAALLRPLPFLQPERLVLIHEASPSFPEMSVSYPDYLDWRQRTRSFVDVGVSRGADVNLTGEIAPQRVRANQVSASYFGILGVRPLVGRTFEEAEDRVGGAPVLVLSEGLARRLFGGAAAALGRTLTVDGTSATVVGVMPPSFRIEGRPELWLPLAPVMVGAISARGNHPGIVGVARLKPGVGFGEGRADLEAVGRGLSEEYSENKAVLPVPVRMQQRLTQDVQGALWLLMGAVVLVLLIAAANVGSLMLARGTGRMREMAIRAAIGAGRLRLLRQLMVESVVLGVLGGALGLALATVGVRILDAHRPESLPDFVTLDVNGRILGFTLAASLVCALFFGLLPALVASRTELHDAMREGAPRMSGGQHRLRVFLVVGEVALALILVVAAGVTSRALAGLLRLDGGFDGRPVLTFRLSIPESRRRNPDEVRAFLDRLVTELRALPSVEEVSTSTLLPIDGPWETSFRSDTQPKLPPDKVQFAAFGYTSPGYSRALGLRLLEGRWFEATDDLTRPDVVVIDDALARDFYSQGSPIGRRLLSNDGKQVREIIGVVHHVAAYGLAGPEPAHHQFYLPIAQMKDSDGPRAPRSVNLAVRTRGLPELMSAPVVRVVAALDPELPVYEVRTMGQLMGESLDAQRFATMQLSLFALLALVLAVVGLYALLSYTVAQRTREIGIRMALGATPSVVLRSVVGRGVAWAGIGLVIGTVGALLTNRLLVGIVSGVRPADPWVFLVTVLGLLAFAALASWVPARRAVRVDAAESLRAE